MNEGQNVGRLLDSLLGPSFPGSDFVAIGPSLFANVSNFLKNNGHPDPHYKALEIISDIAMMTTQRIEQGARIASPKGWLYRCTRRRAIDELRRGREKLDAEEDQVLERILAGREIFSDQSVDYDRARLFIISALENLPPTCRMFVWLDQIERRSPEEIKARLGISDDNHYRSLKSKAKQALRHQVLAILDPIAYERQLRELQESRKPDDV